MTADLYLLAAQRRAEMWRYHETCEPEDFEQLVRDAATDDPALRIVVDTVREHFAAEVQRLQERLGQATQFTISVLPADDINFHSYAIAVEWRGGDTWAVLHRGFALGTDGDWSYEASVGSREAGWLATHRFDLDTALRLAREVAPEVECNGITAAQVLDRRRNATTTKENA